MRTQTALAILASVLASASVCTQALAERVVLRSSTRVEAGARVMLADIAEIEGDATGTLAKVEIAAGSNTPFEIDAATVRSRLLASGAKAATLTIEGSRVVVRPARGGPRVGAASSAGPASIAKSADKAVEEIDPTLHAGDGTPLGVICELLANAFGDDRANLRLRITAAELARLAPTPGLRYEIGARSALRSDCVSFEVSALDGDEVRSRTRVKVTVAVLREVAVAKSPLRRGTVLSDADIAVEQRAVSPTQAQRVADAHAALGSTLARSVEPGAVLGADELAAEIAVRRNDKVVVRREVGALAIETEAIALEDGRVGDRIRLASAEGGKTRPQRASSSRNATAQSTAPSFTAEIVGSRRAVVR